MQILLDFLRKKLAKGRNSWFFLSAWVSIQIWIWIRLRLSEESDSDLGFVITLKVAFYITSLTFF
jgi:hypothetical protein